MKCPKCQSAVPEGHYYCSYCNAQVQSYKPLTAAPARGRFERAGARLLNTLIWMSMIFALILMGRAAPWGGLYAAIRGEAYYSEKSGTDSKIKHSSRAHSKEGSNDGKSTVVAKVVEVSSQAKNEDIESKRAMPQKIEELPSVNDQPLSKKTVDAVDPKNSEEAGLLIKSHSPARIYVNGQFSGVTPHAIKLTKGDYQIRLIADGYEDWTRRIRLKNNQQVEIRADMKIKGAIKE